MKNIHLIPTDKASRLCKESYTGLHLTESMVSRIPAFVNQHIYITNDEEIKEGDWCYDVALKVFQASHNFNGYNNNLCKKIILTTDQDLIKDGVQAINDEFLEWFVENPSCEQVEIQYRYSFYVGKDLIHYKIIIPKEKPKYPIGGFAPGNYSCNCITCKQEFQGDKRAVQCEPCAVKTTEFTNQVFPKGVTNICDCGFPIEICKNRVCPNYENLNHLEWIYQRLINVHNENPNYDYMIKFKSIIEQFKKEKL